MPKKKFIDHSFKDWNPKEYSPEKCVELISLMAGGKGTETFCSKNNISRNTFEDWKRKHKDFEQAFRVGKEKAKEYMVKILHDNMHDVTEEDETESGKILRTTKKFNMKVWNAIQRVSFAESEERELQKKVDPNATSGSQMSQILEGVKTGELNLTEAKKYADIIEVSARIKEVSDLTLRLTEIEKNLTVGIVDDDFKEE